MYRFRLLAFPTLCACLLTATGCGSNWDNSRPRITALRANGQTAASSDETLHFETNSAVVFTCEAEDSDDDPLSYTWSAPAAVPSGVDPGNVAVWSPTEEGRRTITCTVRDDRGGVTSQSVIVEVTRPQVNHAPLATLDPPQVTLAAGAVQVFTCNATDTDGDTLTYTFIASRGTITPVIGMPSRANYTAPSTAGADVVFCVVSDGRGGVTAAQASVTVTSP